MVDGRARESAFYHQPSTIYHLPSTILRAPLQPGCFHFDIALRESAVEQADDWREKAAKVDAQRHAAPAAGRFDPVMPDAAKPRAPRFPVEPSILFELRHDEVVRRQLRLADS